MGTTEVTGLDEFLAAWAGTDAFRGGVVDVVRRLAGAAVELESVVSRGEPELAAGTDNTAANGAHPTGPDRSPSITVAAHDLIVASLHGAPVASILSEQAADPVTVDPGAPLAVAVNPLDGEGNIAANAPFGTIFTIFPAGGAAAAAPFCQAGHRAVAAGYVVYGPATMLAVTVGEGTHLFALDRDRGSFVLRHRSVQVPPSTREVAIDASSRRHWEPPLRTYVDELLAGSDGPRGGDFTMRWMAALVAEAHRILLRGGIYLCPADDRPGHRQGRLHRVYEAFPISMLIEQAGGAATDGRDRVLDTSATDPHERTPLVFGSADKVRRFTEFARTTLRGEYSPLFRQRGLFRS